MMRKGLSCFKIIAAVFIALSMSIMSSLGYIYAAGSDGKDTGITASEEELSENMREDEKKNLIIKDYSEEERAVGKPYRNTEGLYPKADEEVSSEDIYERVSEVVADDTPKTGKCGENVSYTYDEATRTLSISGTGDMTEYEYDNGKTSAPYASFLGKVKKIVIGDGVTHIGSCAFLFCYDTEEIVFPSNNLTIGMQAFIGTISIKNMYIPATVTEIGEYAIGYKCDNGNSGNFTKIGMTIISSENSAGAVYAANNSIDVITALTASGECGENAKWEIDTVSGTLRITGTGNMEDYSYSSCPYNNYKSIVKKIIIGEGITSVGEYAFSGFTNADDISLSSSVTKIGWDAFYNTAIESIVLPSSLTYLDGFSFGSCTRLKEINIPASVTYISDSFINGTYSLKKINVSADNKKFKDLNGILYSADMETILWIPQGYEASTIVFPASVKSHIYSLFYYVQDNGFTFIFLSHPGSIRNDKFGSSICYYNSSDSGWTNDISYMSKDNGTWIDYKKYAASTMLKLSADKGTVGIGEMIRITPEINPAVVNEFVWSSSNSAVLEVNSKGGVTGISPGTAIVTAKSKDGKYSDSISITVSGGSYSTGNHSLRAFDDIIKEYTINTSSRFYACEKQNGLYMYDSASLGFYSFKTGKYSYIDSFSYGNVYFANDKMYIASGGIIKVYDLIKREVILTIDAGAKSINGIGADSNGRIYACGSYTNNYSKHFISLYSSDGTFLDEIISGTAVYDFAGFDDKNGYFYMESFYNYYSWGYDHYGKVASMGKVRDDKLYQIDVTSGFLESGMISRSIAGIEYLCQDYYRYHVLAAQVLENRYLVTSSVLMGRMCVFDSYSATDTEINSQLIIGRGSVDGEDGKYGFGVQAIYNKNNDSFVVYENNKELYEYSFKTGDKLSFAKTAYRVYYMLRCGDNAVIIEYDDNGKYYLETISYKKAASLSISPASKSMKVGANEKLSQNCGMYYSVIPTWKSDNTKIATVNADGVVSAWKIGNTTITATFGGLSATCNLTVTVGDTITPKTNITSIDKSYSANVSQNNYTVYGKTVKSYMYENADKTISTVEWVSSQEKLYIRTFDSSFKEKDATVVDAPLPIFGGFFAGKTYNYAVFGQMNEKDSDDVEVIRIVRYSKDYKTKKELPIKAINTYIPFDAGSLRMDEADGKLYIHTCHEMYESGDGLHHQANMTFVIDEANMTVLDKYSDVMNISQAGYVSHSFNQFIRTDGTYIYRSDHGDAYPRGITLTRAKVGESITKVIYVVPFSIKIGSTGFNATGASLGGLQLSSSNVLVTGNSVDQTQKNTSANRNIFMTISNKDFTTYDIKWFTDFKIKDDTTARTPHLVKLNDEQFLLMWEEYNSKTEKTVTKIATVGAQGDMVESVSTNLRLSDCEPVVTSDGLVRWFITDYNKLQIISINPYNLSAIGGAVSVDKNVDEYAKNGGQYQKDVVLPKDSKLKKGTEIKVKGKVLYKVSGEGTLEYTGNSSLKGKITIPATYKYNGVVWKVTSIADNAFKNNKKITQVTIGDNVLTIGKNAFSGCKALKKVIIGKKVKTIGAKAFYNCKKLKSIIIKSTVLKKVGKNAIKNIHKKCVIKAPKKKLKAYKKLFKKKTGYKKSMKIKKK